MLLPKKNCSIVWKHFKKDANNSDLAICTNCKNNYKRSNGTTNLLGHLKRKHFTILNRETLHHQNDEENDDKSNMPDKYSNYTNYKEDPINNKNLSAIRDLGTYNYIVILNFCVRISGDRRQKESTSTLREQTNVELLPKRKKQLLLSNR
jgi:hypothetical protein